MRILTVLALGLALCAPLGQAFAAPKTTKLTVWVSDEKCGVKGASVGHIDCAKKCVEGGAATIAITNDKKHTIYKIDNQDAVKEHVGHLVKLTGTVTGDSIHVDKVEMLKQPKADAPKTGEKM